jgi:tetratricopeptide (TPR) repeat protein
MPLRPTRMHIVQNFFLIWLDSSIDESNEDCQNSLTELRRIVNTVETYTDADECIEFITETKGENIFVILSGALGFQHVPRIHDMPQIDSIYIFCGNKSKHEQWTKEWMKVKGVFTDVRPLCEVLKQDTRLCDRDSTSITITNAKNSDELEPTFMYTTLFKEIILEIDYDKDEIHKLADECRKLYPGNYDESQIIQEFEDEYHKHTPIWWYTRECFTYQILNRALRTFDTTSIVTMGFFIQDLHNRIKQLHSEQKHLFTETFIVYRGQGLLKTDFVKLKESPGGLLSFNNFLSTSEDRKISHTFAHNALAKLDHVGVLFKMTINPSIPSSPFAVVLGEEGYYKADEEEILFSMNSIFRIGNVKPLNNNNRLFEIELVLTANNDPLLKDVTKKISEEVSGSTGWHRLGKLLIRSGDPEKAEVLYQLLMKSAAKDDSIQIAFLNNQLGQVYSDMGKYSKALEYYEESLEIKKKSLPPNHSSLATSYSNIGGVHSNMGEYSKALKYYEKDLEITKQSLPPTHPDLATSYSNIGRTYSNMGEYSKALEYYKKDLEITKQSLPPTHPDLATTYSNIGRVYSNMGEYSKALKYYEKGLEIKKKSLPPNHYSLAKSYSNIGQVYSKMGEYSIALKYYEKDLEITKKSLPPNHPTHPSLATSYSNIGQAYSNMGEYSEALEYFEKSHKIYEKSFPPTHPCFAGVYSCRGRVYRFMKDYSTALEYFERTLKIDKETLPEKHPDLAITYGNIGDVQRLIGDTEAARSFLEKALEIQKNVTCDPVSLAWTYNYMGETYRVMKQHSVALEFHEKARKILEKSLPSSHPDLAGTQHNLANVYKEMKQYKLAYEHAQRAVEIAQQKLPEKHPHLLEYRETASEIRRKL